MLDGSADVGHELGSALDAGSLQLVYQPEVDLRTSQVVALETLARWPHDHRGHIEPAEFVAAAEQSGLIHRLGAWVLSSALGEFAAWRAELPDLDVVLRVNAAVDQIVQPSYADQLRAGLHDHGVRATDVCIEITEGGPRRDVADLGEPIRGLRELGVRVAIDDLGNGYSTLGMLRAYPVDVVKIDRALVGDVDSDPRAAAIVAALVTVTDSLDITLVAEGIETQAERDTLVDLGCRRGQGYLLSMPLERDEIAGLLVAQGRRRG